jgi:hypothetical protein
MGRHLQILCEVCGNSMRSDNLKRHRETGGCDKTIQAKKLKTEKASRHKSIKKMIGEGLKDNAYLKMKHLCFEIEKFAEGKSVADVLALWKPFCEVTAMCGECGETKKPHGHLLGEPAVAPSSINAKMRACFTEDKQYRAPGFKHSDNASFPEKAKAIKHFIDTLCYIQTEFGHHPKTHHTNPHTFKTDFEKKAFLSNLYGPWPWAQVIYIRYLYKKQEIFERQLEHGDNLTEEIKAKIRAKMIGVDERLLKLEKTWGEEHHYTDEELMADLEEFILYACTD